jgi:hypothetical protein
MSNKQMTAVEWLIENTVMSKDIWYDEIKHALQMESHKQQKYDEMVRMLEICKQTTSSMIIYDEIEQLIKEAKEL